MIKVGQEDMTGKRDSKKVLLKLLLTRAKNSLQKFGIRNWLLDEQLNEILDHIHFS